MSEVGRNMFVILALFLVLAEPGLGYYPWEKVYHIHIQNRMSRTNPQLVVHVKSKNNDLKEHTIGYDGEFQFHFRPSFWHKTHFYCVFQSGKKVKTLNIFKPGVYKNETEACRRLKQRPLYWKVKDDGFYRSCDDKKFKKVYKWGQKSSAS
ncbi:hypothetical protein GQ457_13G001470 [Hibiscus cannabinus]